MFLSPHLHILLFIFLHFICNYYVFVCSSSTSVRLHVRLPMCHCLTACVCPLSLVLRGSSSLTTFCLSPSPSAYVPLSHCVCLSSFSSPPLFIPPLQHSVCLQVRLPMCHCLTACVCPLSLVLRGSSSLTTFCLSPSPSAYVPLSHCACVSSSSGSSGVHPPFQLYVSMSFCLCVPVSRPLSFLFLWCSWFIVMDHLPRFPRMRCHR